MQRRDNYQIQLQQAKRHFLSYDQQELIRRCGLRHDEKYLYTKLLSQEYRICCANGDMERLCNGTWVDANTFHEVMTILDWLCDSREDRYITGRWINLVNHNHYFHRDLQEKPDPDAEEFSKRPASFAAACEALQGRKMPGGDISYAIELLDGLQILVQLWHGDDEFPSRLCFLWDENTERYLRYETTWYALGLLVKRLRENMPMETERLLLRPWRKADAAWLYEYAKDPAVGYPAGWPAHTSVEDSRRIIENVLSAPETYAVCLKENNIPIGSIGLKTGEATDLTERSDECELGYWLGVPFWGQGLIPEAAQRLIRRGFEELGMRAIWCGYYEGNERSRRVQEKLGFSYHHRSENVPVPLLRACRTGYVLLLTKQDWEEKHGTL